MKAASYMRILDFATELYTNGDSKNTWVCTTCQCEVRHL